MLSIAQRKIKNGTTEMAWNFVRRYEMWRRSEVLRDENLARECINNFSARFLVVHISRLLQTPVRHNISAKIFFGSHRLHSGIASRHSYSIKTIQERIQLWAKTTSWQQQADGERRSWISISFQWVSRSLLHISAWRGARDNWMNSSGNWRKMKEETSASIRDLLPLSIFYFILEAPFELGCVKIYFFSFVPPFHPHEWKWRICIDALVSFCWTGRRATRSSFTYKFQCLRAALVRTRMVNQFPSDAVANLNSLRTISSSRAQWTLSSWKFYLLLTLWRWCN